MCTNDLYIKFQVLCGLHCAQDRFFKTHEGNDFYWMGCNIGTFNIQVVWSRKKNIPGNGAIVYSKNNKEITKAFMVLLDAQDNKQALN